MSIPGEEMQQRIESLESKVAELQKEQPAPEKPSADRVTTENLDALQPMLRPNAGIPKENARNAGIADIRANVDRETKGLREENARLRGEVERLGKELRTVQEFKEEWFYPSAKKHHLEMMCAYLNDTEKQEKLPEHYAGGDVAEIALAALVRARRERDEAKAANREQRRKGAEDAAAWLCELGQDVTGKRMIEALGRGEVLRDGVKSKCEHVPGGGYGKMDGMVTTCGKCGAVMSDTRKKQDRAPEKTGRLPNSNQIVFARGSDGSPWMLIAPWCSSLDPGGRETATVDIPGFGNTKLTRENEGVLWRWPTPGMGI